LSPARPHHLKSPPVMNAGGPTQTDHTLNLMPCALQGLFCGNGCCTGGHDVIHQPDGEGVLAWRALKSPVLVALPLMTPEMVLTNACPLALQQLRLAGTEFLGDLSRESIAFAAFPAGNRHQHLPFLRRKCGAKCPDQSFQHPGCGGEFLLEEDFAEFPAVKAKSPP